MQKVRLGPLDAVITPPSAGPGDPLSRAAPLHTVLLHGFGAPGSDLIGLTGALAPLPQVTFVYPAGLHSLGFPFSGDGRAWWPLDFNDLDGARLRGDWDVVVSAEPSGLAEAREALGEAIAALERDHGIARERLVLGGFSQGAMLACDYVLRASTPLAGLVLLSGMPIALPTWTKLLPARRGLPVFQSHSPDDQVLPFAQAERLATLLAHAGLHSEFVRFRGGHGIPLPVIDGLRSFLTRLAGATSGH